MQQRDPWRLAWAVVCLFVGTAIVVLPGCAEAADESLTADDVSEAGSSEGSAPGAGAADVEAARVIAPDDADGWEESAGLQLLVNGDLDPGARIFDSPDFQHTLVISMDGPAYLLALRAQEVRRLSSAGLAWTNGDLPVPDPAQGETVAVFVNEGGLLLFDTETASYQLQPEPPLVGSMTLAKLREAKPDYVLLADEFEPDAKTLEALRAAPGGTVRVFFGTWCSYCKHWLPHFMKTMELAGDKLTVEYYGVSEDMSEPADELSRYDVSETPSFVVYREGAEIGRIIEEPIDSMESDLLQILQK